MLTELPETTLAELPLASDASALVGFVSSFFDEAAVAAALEEIVAVVEEVVEVDDDTDDDDDDANELDEDEDDDDEEEETDVFFPIVEESTKYGWLGKVVEISFAIVSAYWAALVEAMPVSGPYRTSKEI